MLVHLSRVCGGPRGGEQAGRAAEVSHPSPPHEPILQRPEQQSRQGACRGHRSQSPGCCGGGGSPEAAAGRLPSMDGGHRPLPTVLVRAPQEEPAAPACYALCPSESWGGMEVENLHACTPAGRLGAMDPTPLFSLFAVGDCKLQLRWRGRRPRLTAQKPGKRLPPKAGQLALASSKLPKMSSLFPL